MELGKGTWKVVGGLYVANIFLTFLLERIIDEAIKDQLVQDISLGVVVGIAIATPVVYLVARVEATRGRNVPRPATPSVSPSATDSVAAFDPYSIITELGGVDLSGLSETDSFMMITLNVRNVSGYPVTITGVKGRIRCAGAECNPVATVENEPRQLRTSARDRVPCTIRQPISSEMMQAVAREALAGNLVISLSGLQWVGSVALPQDSVPLEDCYIQEDFVVKGPFREKRDAGSLFRLRTTFLSSEHYDSHGEPKQHEDQQAVQGAEQLSAPQQLSEGVRALLREGNQVLDAITNVNQPVPKALAENWFKRGRNLLEGDLSGSYVTDWNHTRRPKQGFTGMITPDRKQMWDSVKARVELLEALDDELRGS